MKLRLLEQEIIPCAFKYHAGINITLARLDHKRHCRMQSEIKIHRCPVGGIGQPPNPNLLQMTLPVTTKGRLTTTEEFENIILKANLDGSMVLLKDVARTELGAQNYDIVGELDQKPTTLIAVYQQYGANALDVGNSVKKRLVDLEKNFPAGIEYSIPYDVTKFIKASITEVSMTIVEAAILVVLIVYIFLQSFRATLVPLIAMLVSIIGTFFCSLPSWISS